MSVYERTISMEVEPEHVYRFIADPKNARLYSPVVRKIDSENADRLRVLAHVHGEDHEADVLFYKNPAQHRIEWRTEGHHPYQGAMWVRQGDTTPEISELTMELSFPSLNSDDPRGEGILLSMQNALEAIHKHVR